MGYTVKTLESHHVRPSVCLVAHFAYGVLAGGRSGHIGGVERQTTLMARCLAKRGYRVSMVTWDEGQPDDLVIDGVRVIKVCRQDVGLPGLRFFYPRWSSLVRALRRADADVYYQNCGEYVTGQIALWCRRHDRKFVYSIASDPDCDVKLPKMQKKYEAELYRYGLLNADSVIVQTRKQQSILRDGYGLDSTVIPTPCVDAVGGEFVAPDPPNDRPHILWVGRIATVKRLEWLLDIAEACPQYDFDVVGPVDGTEYAAGLERRAARITNVVLHGRVDPADMRVMYTGKALLCCTSVWEGFPNTFLEAWSLGLPVVSTVDPDCRITALGLGGIGENIDGLITEIRGLVASPQRWRTASLSAREYFVANHTIEAAFPLFEEVLCGAVTAAGTSNHTIDRQHA